MPIKPEELLSYAGIDPEKFDSIDAAKEAFDTTFVKKDKIKDILIKEPELADGIVGKRMSIIDRKVDAIVKAAGVDFDFETVKGKKVEEKFEIYQPLIESTFSELKKKASEGNDERVKSLELEKSKLESKYKDTFKLLEDTKVEFDGFKNSIKQKEVESKKEQQWNEALSSIEFSPDVDELKKKGFINLLKESYVVDLDEKETPFTKDAKTNERVKSPNKTAEFLELKDIVKIEAEKYKVIKQSPYGGNPAPGRGGNQPIIPPAATESTRKLNGR